MTQDATADAVAGPGETPPGPSALQPDDTAGPTGSPERSTAGVTGDVADGSGPVDPAVVLPAELAGAAQALFGDRLDLAAAYAELLATDGVLRGLIGPREAPRIWDRHLLNCAVVAELIPNGSTVLDVGSGAGLPGVVLAIARPDLTVTLIEPLARRTSFLLEAVQSLGLARQVRVLRGRADEAASGAVGVGPLTGDIVTARAVAPLDRLAAWCLPLIGRGGRLLALKGASAADEITEHAAVARLGGGTPTVRHCGADLIEPPATVVEVVRERVVPGTQPKPARSARSASRPRPARSERPGSRRR